MIEVAGMRVCDHPHAVDTVRDVQAHRWIDKKFRGGRWHLAPRWVGPSQVIERKCPDCTAFALACQVPGMRTDPVLIPWVMS